jgi:hypothetical protein
VSTPLPGPTSMIRRCGDQKILTETTAGTEVESGKKLNDVVF